MVLKERETNGEQVQFRESGLPLEEALIPIVAKSFEPSCRVDAKPPSLPLSAVRRPVQMARLQNLTKDLDLMNIAYFQALLAIHIKGGVVNSFRTSKPKAENSSQKRILMRAKKFIMEQNKMLADSLAAIKPAVQSTASLQSDWEETKNKIHDYRKNCFYKDLVAREPPLPGTVQYVTEKSRKYADNRPRVRFEISVEGGGVFGFMTLMLYSDYNPILCQRFLRFVDGCKTIFPKGSAIYRIFPNFFFITGLEDSLSRAAFIPDQINSLRHAEPGVLSIYNVPSKFNNGSQLVVTFSAKSVLDDGYIPFGKVIRGFKTLRKIEFEGTQFSGYPKAPLQISNMEEL